MTIDQIYPLILSSDACQLTMDSNTAYKQLYLSRGGRKAALKRDAKSYPYSATRFDCLPQVLCKEPLEGGPFYWEVEWRRGLPRDHLQGHQEDRLW